MDHPQVACIEAGAGAGDDVTDAARSGVTCRAADRKDRQPPSDVPFRECAT
ncbi:hypothetical protein LMG28614_03480 [Paraburkholderia ultramafica]|uniref:Uncharacterized protein n=1 Tax=Paraburkholderia ultramafica TaxID=1544867 RepID=A0A6S7BB58_9BURK|nr:hypothetical protein LMG28614_03480 [Paraburkholderia ultramafica]